MSKLLSTGAPQRDFAQLSMGQRASYTKITVGDHKISKWFSFDVRNLKSAVQSLHAQSCALHQTHAKYVHFSPKFLSENRWSNATISVSETFQQYWKFGIPKGVSRLRAEVFAQHRGESAKFWTYPSNFPSRPVKLIANDRFLMIARIGNATRLSGHCRNRSLFTRVRCSPPTFLRRRNPVAKYMYIRKLSLISSGAVSAVSAEQICHANVEKVTYMGTARTYTRIRNSGKERKKTKARTAFGNFAEYGYAWYAAVIASSGFECLRGRRPVALRRRSFAADLTCAWCTGCSQTGAREMKRSSRTFSSVLLLNGEFSHLQNQSATVCRE